MTEQPANPLRVLLSAYACEPGRGSEPGVGWNWSLQAARHHDVWVLTRSNNRAAIEQALAATPQPRLRFHYYDLPAWLRFWKRKERGIRLYYILWQLGVFREARRLQRMHAFDVVHHVTFNTLEVPGLLWLLGPPFVWGPVGGAQEPPEALRSYFGGRWYRERLRVWRKRLGRFNPLLRTAVRRASVILAANGETERRLLALGAARCLRELETGIALPAADPGGSAPPDRPFTIMWAGSLTLRKGPRLALDVMAALKGRGLTFQAVFVGGGPLRDSMHKWIRDLGLEAEVVLLHEVSHGAMGRQYAMSDVFLFSSLHDTSGNVVLEAMSHGLPVISLDQHGVKDMVDAESGIKVPVRDLAQVVNDLTDSIERLARDRALRIAMGQAARRRAGDVYGWARKGELLQWIYGSVITCRLDGVELARPSQPTAVNTPGPPSSS